MTAKYLSRSDYEARIVRHEQAKTRREQEIRSQPRVTQTDGLPYGYVNLFAIHPAGQQAPELPAPWRWVSHLQAYACYVPAAQAPALAATARERFGLQ